jgi:O-antigen/teichoic acid export membrane protein
MTSVLDESKDHQDISQLPTQAHPNTVSLIQNLVKSSGIYALASLTSPLVALLLTPFLTHHLSHSTYGALAVLNTVITLVAGVTELGLHSAFLRAYTYDYETERDRAYVLSTVVILLSLTSIPVVIVGSIAAPQLSVLLVNSSSFSDSIRLAAFVILLQNLTIPGFWWLRAENRAAFSSILSLLNLFATAAATIVLVGTLHMGIAGALIATGAGYAVVVICTIPIILRHAGLRLRFDITWKLLTFGVPNVINLLSGWVLQLSDRYLLGHLGSLSQTASYAVAYSLGGIATSIIIAPFSLAWWSVIYTIAKKDDASRVFQLIFRWFSIVLLLATFGISLLGLSVLDIFFPPAYHSAAPVIPIIAVSTAFSGIYLVVSLGLSIQRKTWLAAILFSSSALLNVGINIILIPPYGAMGAAIATLVAYAVLALMGYIANQRIFPVPFEIGLFIIALSVGIALYTGSDFLAQAQTIYVVWGIHIGAFILYGGYLLLLGKLPNWKLWRNAYR